MGTTMTTSPSFGVGRREGLVVVVAGPSGDAVVELGLVRGRSTGDSTDTPLDPPAYIVCCAVAGALSSEQRRARRSAAARNGDDALAGRGRAIILAVFFCVPPPVMLCSVPRSLRGSKPVRPSAAVARGGCGRERVRCAKARKVDRLKKREKTQEVKRKVAPSPLFSTPSSLPSRLQPLFYFFFFYCLAKGKGKGVFKLNKTKTELSIRFT